MKKQLLAVIIGASLVWSNDAMSHIGPTGNNNGGGNSGGSQGNGGAVAQAKSANCAPATARLTMEFNDVGALIEQGGSMFQNRATGNAAYEVPRGSNLYAIYAGALWMGGTDVNGQLKLAALRYRQGNDFWPGPLTVQPGSGNYDPAGPVGDDAVRDFGEANISDDQCLAYDKFYTIRKAEVIRFSIWWECQNGIIEDGCDEITAPTNEELNRIYAWPAHGDISLGQDYWLAPYYDRNNDQFYNPDDGDYPWYDDILGRDDIQCGIDRRISLFGDETHWWIFNDKGNIHTETNGDPIGMEIRAQAFAFATNDEVNRMTFYNYELINRGTQTLYDTYFSQYIDADIGGYSDDYVGCDVSRGLGYTLNGDNFDATEGGNQGYGENPPAIGVDFFEGPYQDADGIDNPGPYYDPVVDSIVAPSVSDALSQNGIVYNGIGVGYGDNIIDNERFGMRRFTYYTSTSAYPYNDPQSAAQYYNFMSGFWADGSQTYYGGAGYAGSNGVTSIESDYMFPGDSDPLNWSTAGVEPGFDWDESTNNNQPADRRFVQSAGPFTLRPGAVNNITVGIVYGRATDGDLYASVEAMKRADTKAQALFDNCFRILDPPSAPKLSIQELENQLVLTLENPATSNNYLEGYAEADDISITDPSVDNIYRFEGYQIFQLVDAEAGISDVNDPAKARLVAQCDLENNIERIINFEFDEDLGFAIPVEKVDGANIGIQHSFLLTEDAFAQGDRALVNHKKYYYVAIAYAYNDMADLQTGLPQLYDPTDVLSLEGQETPYISSRLSFDGTAIKPTIGIPHNPMPEADGTAQNIEYGSSPRITRIDGTGNGGNIIELTEESRDEILANGTMNEPTYEYGAGPINIKVVDPLNVAGGYYECRFRDYNTSSSNGADTASWVIYQYASKGGALLDSVSSDFTLATDNEQLIPEWGVSVQIYQDPYYLPEGGSGGTEARTTDLLASSITFADSSLRWLTGVEDNDAFYPTNWIRSGDYTPEDDPNDPAYECDDEALPYFNPCSYWDRVGADNDKDWARILGGIIAPAKLTGYHADYQPLAFYNMTGNNFSQTTQTSISFLPSIDLVLTNDKSKWTRCPVVELGRDASLNVGGAEPGELRASPSKDVNGNDDPSSTGMGWFPGYAIDLETGSRLYIAFGENSFLGAENGADMMWNPSDRLVDAVGTPLMGGMHAIWIFSHDTKSVNNYISASSSIGNDYPAYPPAANWDLNQHQLYQDLDDITSMTLTQKRQFYGSMAYVMYPMLSPGYSMNSGDDIPTDCTIKLRVNKEYKNYVTSGKNDGMPMYGWDMEEIRTEVGSEVSLTDALDLINVVPNPYYAYSQYEENRLDSRVKITNLPERCTVKIYSANGKLIRTFKKDSPITSLDWDLNNHKGIPIASGLYLIHVEVPGAGERIVKFFGGMRQIDLQGI